MNNRISVLMIAILLVSMGMGCSSAQTQPQIPQHEISDSPCLDALGESVESAYETSKKKVQESRESGVLKDAGDKYDELKDRAGKAYHAFMEEK